MRILFYIIICFVFCYPARTQEIAFSDSLINEEFFFINQTDLLANGELDVWGIRFKLGQKELCDSNDARVLALASVLHQNSNLIIELGMHMDCRGSKISCVALSYGRAKALRARLIELGIAPERIIAQGYGESMPYQIEGKTLTCAYINRFDPRKRAELHALNRRMTIKILR
mgnify:CR=1 FL=1